VAKRTKNKKSRVKSKGRKKSLSRSPYRLVHGISSILIFGAIYFGYVYYTTHFVSPWHAYSDKAGYSSVLDNYEDEVRAAADEFNLPFSYLMSLIQLECSGKKPAGYRFEPHVFKRLQDVRDGKRNNYENVTSKHLSDASDDALKNLATSWGPFQLMGYKCILLDVKIRDIRGGNGVHFGAEWINRTYGNRLRNSEFKNCFHLHNTGITYPKAGLPTTHDPQYVPRGLAGISRFNKASNAR
jgi:hypothetical protein